MFFLNELKILIMKSLSNQDLAVLFESGTFFKLFDKAIKRLIKGEPIKCVGFVSLDLDKGLNAPSTHLMYDSATKAGVVYVVDTKGDVTKVSDEVDGEEVVGNIFDEPKAVLPIGTEMVAGLKGEPLMVVNTAIQGQAADNWANCGEGEGYKEYTSNSPTLAESIPPDQMG